MKYVYLFVALAAALLLLGILVPSYAAGGSDACQYFPETSHFVCDRLLSYYNTHGGLAIFGYPRSRAYFDPAMGRAVQYFQRSRLEMHTENPEPYRVQQGLLGDELGYTKFPPAAPEEIPAANDVSSQYFPETGHVVSFAFLKFYREHGGLDVFGYPRSDFMYEDGAIVQYFQRARMTWHPDSEPDITLTNLGDIYIEHFGVPEIYLEPEYNEHARIETKRSASDTRISTAASVGRVIIGKDEQQVIFVYVIDQYDKPVEGALAQALIHYPTGDQAIDLLPTNASGFSSHSFYVAPAVQPGEQIQISVTVEFQGLSGEADCFFLPWW